MTPPTTTDSAGRPRIICLCGSTRFKEEFARANFRETLAGKIVLSIGCDAKTDAELGITPEVKARLDLLHLRKIELADEVLILNVSGYIGNSTRRELEHAKRLGKMVHFLESQPVDAGGVK
jgi:hypothetical protein